MFKHGTIAESIRKSSVTTTCGHSARCDHVPAKVLESSSSNLRPRRGFTLAEALLASTFLAIIGAVSTLPFVAGAQHLKEATKLEQAVALGQALMEEILARPFDDADPTRPSTPPAAGTLDRSQYATILQFASYSESDHQIRDYRGVAVTSASSSGFWRSATVQSVTYPGQDPADSVNLAHIQVLVYSGTDVLVQLDRLASRDN